jgi:hypothetical protein
MVLDNSVDAQRVLAVLGKLIARARLAARDFRYDKFS